MSRSSVERVCSVGQRQNRTDHQPVLAPLGQVERLLVAEVRVGAPNPEMCPFRAKYTSQDFALFPNLLGSGLFSMNSWEHWGSLDHLWSHGRLLGPMSSSASSAQTSPHHPSKEIWDLLGHHLVLQWSKDPIG